MEEKYYEILRHYVNPNDCATVVKQLLSLHNVVGQSELLKAFEEYLNSEEAEYYTGDFRIKEFLEAFNCG